MYKKTIILLVFTGIIFFATACQEQDNFVSSTSVPVLLALDQYNGQATLTPFQPLETTPTWTATVAPSITPTPSPTLTPTITLTPVNSPTPKSTQTSIPWYENHSMGDDVKSIVLLGSDRRPGQGFRTDIIILVTINPQNHKISMISFPRDLYVDIPGWGYNRINVVQSLGGFDLLAQTFASNFKIHPQHFVLIDFNGFTGAIDSLGGINVNVEKPIRDQCDVQYVGRNGICSFDKGWHEMNGQTALWYVRSRHTTSDIDRTRRAQEVLQAILNRVVGIDGISHAPDLYEKYKQSVETDMELSDLIPFIQMAPQLTDSSKINRFVIGPGLVWDYIVPGNGAMVLMPDLPAIQNYIWQAVYSK
jgi:polyisoprenyl-teichoic acid--peptidoglycan teichoic acid transferase